MIGSKSDMAKEGLGDILRQNFQKWLNQGFFQKFFVNLIQDDLNDTKMEFFYVGLSVDPLDPPKFTPSLDPHWRSVHWRSLVIIIVIWFDCANMSEVRPY